MTWEVPYRIWFIWFFNLFQDIQTQLYVKTFKHIIQWRGFQTEQNHYVYDELICISTRCYYIYIYFRYLYIHINIYIYTSNNTDSADYGSPHPSANSGMAQQCLTTTFLTGEPRCQKGCCRDRLCSPCNCCNSCRLKTANNACNIAINWSLEGSWDSLQWHWHGP